MFVASMLVVVVSSIVRPSIVDEAVDGGYTIEIHIQNTVNMPRLQGEIT